MRVLTVCAVLLLAACAPGAVQDRGDGHYVLTATSSSGGYAGSHEQAIEEANDYCDHHRQMATIESFEDLRELGPNGEHTSRLAFTCVPPRTLHF